jgi:membrane-bound lytic murein transglycosylase D
MKTMLKRKQKRAGYVCYSLLLLTTPAITAMTQDVSYSLDATRHKANQTAVWFTDTVAKKSNVDSVSLAVVQEAVEKKSIQAPVVRLNSYGSKFVKDYVLKNASYLSEIKEKRGKYFAVMDDVFSKYNLPLELKYLAVVESELNLKAVSHVGAVGMWQLMPGTAKTLGLKVTKKYDERRLCYKSTHAAAKYLNDLYKQFGDWLLVIAAYNSGPGPVYSAIKKSGSRNFWRLQQYLPAETRMHVKRFVGTHYYFEGKGSIATLTKAEAAEYLKALAKYTEAVEATEAVVADPEDKEIPVALVQ